MYFGCKVTKIKPFEQKKHKKICVNQKNVLSLQSVLSRTQLIATLAQLVEQRIRNA